MERAERFTIKHNERVLMQDEVEDWSIEAWIAEQQRLILEYLKTLSGGENVQK